MRGRNASLLSALTIQRRVVFALLMREALTRYGRHNLGFLWLFVEPMMFTIGITIFWTLTQSVHGSNLAIVPFAITGYSSVLLWRNMPARLVGAVGPNAGIMHHRNVRLMDIYTSRLLLESAGVTMSFSFLTIFFVLIEWTTWPEDVLLVISGWLLLNWFGWSLGIFIGSLSERTEVVDKLWHPITYFLFPVSGAAFIVDPLPAAVQSIVLALPMVHCTELIREGFFGSTFKPHYSVAYVVAFCLVLSCAGLLNMHLVSKRIVLE
jgi:ABC-type polysaccharide/polyol phosphate export permease